MNYYKAKLSIFVLLAVSRFIPHPPNFTPIISMAILSGFALKNFKHSILLILSTMFITDIFLGFHKNMLFVYSSLYLITAISFKFSHKLNFKNLILYCLLSSICFFIFTNFGVWFFGNLYEKNFSGLIECYIMAIPFFKNTIISTIIFSYSTFILDSFFKNKLKILNKSFF